MRYDLYINGQLCDLDSSSLIVLTYTMEQLTNPTAVKNTYSHEVELPSTERNDIIFSHFYRNDYLVGIANFSPLERVPFTIYNELSEIVESGYIKLDEVQVDKVAHTYKVVLYGGLGSFFYMLGYSDNAGALALGDLQYMQNAEEEKSLNLQILRQTIDYNGAWGRLAGNNRREQYDVINFAPTYQGMPEGDFAKDKALFIGQALGAGSGGYTDTLRNPIYGFDSANGSNTMYKRYIEGADSGYRCTIVDLGAEHTEWEVKDLRTYLQRPVLSVRKFIEAVQRRATAYGYTLNLDSAFFNADNPYYNDAWVTLPSLQSITRPSNKQQARISGEVVINAEAVQTIPLTVEMPTDTNGYEFGSSISNVEVSLPSITVGIIGGSDTKALLAGDGNANVWYIQLYGTKSSQVVAYSDVKVLTDTNNRTSLTTINNATGYTPNGGTNTYEEIRGYFAPRSAGLKQFTQNITFATTNTNTPTEWYLRIEKYTYQGTESVANCLFAPITFIDIEGNESTVYQWLSISEGIASILSGTAEVSANTTIRSGCIISKSEMLNIGKSPLELLLSYCKLFGLVWHYESNSNTITLQQRTTFYNEGTAVDWSDRIDRNKAMTIKPFEFDKRFYDFELETQGEWAEQYADKYSRPYGAQRVNTGYNFDKEAKNLLEGNALKGGAEVLEQGKYYNNITQGTYTLGSATYNKICPSVFLDGGKYALYDANGNPTEYDVTTPTNEANVEYMNALQGYDAQPKAQLHKENKLESEGGMLLLYTGSIDVDNSPYKNFGLTDDIAEMGILNEGQLCWVLEGSSVGRLTGETLPKFVRTGYNLSLDMGVPLELDNPDADTEAVQNSIYSQYWRDYLGDRYDTNSRVCQCYVDLRGLQVSNALFRNFYYFDNAVWVLNKITNYSMTTEGSTLCEFVKVQDVKNYKGE